MKAPGRCPLVLAVLAACLLLPGCAAFGRKFNQALPAFMRSEPGAKEMEIISEVRRARDWSPAELKAQEALYRKAEAAIQAKQYSDGINLLEEYLETYPTSRFDERARFMLGESHYLDEDFNDAFDALKDFNDRYVVSDFGPRVMEYQYQIGLAYIEGKHSFFFGIFSRKSTGKKYLDHVVERYPTGARAPDAQWAIASYHMDDEDWFQAGQAYEFLADKYPDSPWFPAARYYSGYCLYRQVKGAKYDPVTMESARKAFGRYLRDVPDGEWQDQARQFQAELLELVARHVLLVAEWYIDQGKPYSARYYLESVRSRYPATESARDALKLLKELGTEPVADPQPPPKEAAPVERSGQGGS